MSTRRRLDDGRTGIVFADITTTDDDGAPVRAWWVLLPDGSKELWHDAETEEVPDGPV